MRHRPRTFPVLSALLLAAVRAAAQGQPPTPEEALASAPATMKGITAQELRAHLEVLASDAYGGRLTATEGQVKAAEYVAAHFEKCGLKPLGEDDGQGGRLWTQGYTVTLTKVTPTSGLADAGGKRLHAHGAWSLPRRKRGGAWDPIALDAPLRFVGRVVKGDLAADDLSGVIPVAVVEMDKSRDQRMDVMRAMMQGSQREFGKVRAAAAELADAKARAAVVLVKEFNVPFLVAANMSALYPGKPMVSLGEKAGDGMMGSIAAKPQIPVLILGGPDAEAVARELGLDPAVVFGDGGAAAGAPTPSAFKLSLTTEIETTKAVNVAGVLEGSDPDLKDEAVLYSAHMDHVGLAADGQAFNGADDDGSGTCSLLELAQGFGSLPPSARPKRSVIFLSVSGEELGLWGSAHYANQPTWPIDRIVANINIDMIGRSTEDVPEDAVAVTPTFKHGAYSTLAQEAALLAQAFGLHLTDGDRFYTRSDHYNFAEKDVPVVFFCDDEHADYHMPTDDVDKIEFGKMEKIVRMAFLLGHRTADRAPRPETIGAHSDWFGEKATKRKKRNPEPAPAGEGGKK